MVSIGNQPSFAPTMVEPLSDGNYQVSSEGSDKPQVMNEEAVNQMLAPYGLKMVGGAAQSLDNFVINSNNAAVVTNYGDDPALPDVDGKAFSNQQLSEHISGRDFSDMSLGALTWMALSEMTRTSMRDQHDAKQIRNTFQKMKYDAKSEEIKSSKEKIEAERSAAWAQLATSVVAAAVNIGGAANVGSQYTGFNQFTSQAVGQGGSQVITQLGTALDKQVGFQRTADDKQIEVQQLQQLQEHLDMNIDEARSTYEESKDQFKQAQKLLTDYVDRQTQIVQTITR